MNPNIRIVDENGKTVEAPVAPAPFEAKALTNKQIAKIADLAPKAHKRHTLALCTAVDCTVRDLAELRLDDVRQMVDAAAGVEGRDLAPLELRPETDDVFFGAATTEQRKPIVDRLAEAYGPRFADEADETASAAPPRVPAVEIGYDDTVAPVMIRLQYPITVDSARLAEINLYPPSYGHTQAVRAGRMTRHDMIAAMARIPPDALDGLRYPDAERVITAAFDMAPNLVDG